VNQSNVQAFPRYKEKDIPEALRALANQIEHGQVDAVRIVVAMEPEKGYVDYVAFGCESFSYAHAVGICVAAQSQILKCGKD
jgi:hypothetical protein